MYAIRSYYDQRGEDADQGEPGVAAFDRGEEQAELADEAGGGGEADSYNFV